MLIPEQVPYVSVVAFYNERALLNKCVASLLKQSYEPTRYEILLVNDGSDDGSEREISEVVEANKTRIRILTEINKGPAGGRNFGISNAKGSIVAFTDSDCVADEDWLKQLVANYTSEEVGGVEGKVETDWDQLMAPIRVSPAGFGHVTCNISYRRDVLQKVGLFDEQFRWKEDEDLAYRVIKGGWKIATNERAIVYHPVTKLNTRGLVRSALKHQYDVLFYRKHPDVAKDSFHAVRLGPIALTRGFFATSWFLLIFLLALAGLLTGNLIALFPLISTGIWAIFYVRSSQWGRSRRKYPESSLKALILWMSILVFVTEMARLWGTFRFRRLFL